MIVALEGYHGAGKSTLFTVLKIRLAMHIGWVQFSKRDWPREESICESQLVELFSMLYEPSRLYIFDRIWPITSVVYNTLNHERTHLLVEYPFWLPDLRILWIDGGFYRDSEEVAYNDRIKVLLDQGVRFASLPRIRLSERTLLATQLIEEWYGQKVS